VRARGRGQAVEAGGLEAALSASAGSWRGPPGLVRWTTVSQLLLGRRRPRDAAHALPLMLHCDPATCCSCSLRARLRACRAPRPVPTSLRLPLRAAAAAALRGCSARVRVSRDSNTQCCSSVQLVHDRQAPSSRRALSLSPAAHVDGTVARQPSDEPADRRARMSSRVHVRVGAHRVALAADEARGRCLGLDEDLDDAAALRGDRVEDGEERLGVDCEGPMGQLAVLLVLDPDSSALEARGRKGAGSLESFM